MFAAVLLPACCLGADDPVASAAVPAQPVSIEVDRVTAGRGGNWAEIGLKVAVGTAGAGIVTVIPHAPAGIAISPASRVIEITAAGAYRAEFRARSETGDWRQAGDVSFNAELAANGQSWRDRVTVVWPASLGTDGLFHAPRGWFIALVAGLLAIAWYRYRVLASGPRRRWLPDARLLFDVLVLLAIEAFILAPER